jgi:hypothetical protein
MQLLKYNFYCFLYILYKISYSIRLVLEQRLVYMCFNKIKMLIHNQGYFIQFYQQNIYLSIYLSKGVHTLVSNINERLKLTLDEADISICYV